MPADDKVLSAAMAASIEVGTSTPGSPVEGTKPKGGSELLWVLRNSTRWLSFAGGFGGPGEKAVVSEVRTRQAGSIETLGSPFSSDKRTSEGNVSVMAIVG